MRIDQSIQDSCTILAPVGELDLAAVPSLRQVLLKRLSEQPVAVICDLSGLASVDEACAAVFVTVPSHPSSRWPGTNLLLCGARPAVAEVLERLGVPQYLPVHPTLDDALAQAGVRPPYLRDELPLTPSAAAPATARRFVRDACRQWRLGAVDDPNDPTSGGYHGQMAVLVKANGRFGAAYMAAIKPFRHLIVYPALMRSIERGWLPAAPDSGSGG